MVRKPRGAIQLRLSPSSGGETTRFRMEGTLSTRLPAAALHQLLSPLVYWSGLPVHVVLAADHQAWWCEAVADALAGVPLRHVSVSFDLDRAPDDVAAE